jgi:hypothetical protein
LTSELSCEGLKGLLTFALHCGTDTFTVAPSSENSFQNVLQQYHIGVKKAEIPVQPEENRRFEKLHFWKFSRASLLKIVQLCPHWLYQPSVRWGFYRYGEDMQLFLVVYGKTAYFTNLVPHQWEALFRLGFRFALCDSSRQEFSEADLPENKRAREAAEMERASQIAEQGWREFAETATDEELRAVREEAERALALMEADRGADPTGGEPPTRPRQLADLLADPYMLTSYPSCNDRRRGLPPRADSNKHILAWWSTAHDELLKEHIRRDGWKWWPSVTAIESLTTEEAFFRWQREDPECLSRDVKEVLTDFARARAKSLGYTRVILCPPGARECLLCGDTFLPQDHHNVVQRAKQVFDKICPPCVSLAVKPGSISASRKEVVAYLRKLTNALGRVPRQGFGNEYDLAILDETNVVPVMKTLQSKPSEMLVKGLFGSWLAALLEAQILDGGARKTPRGTQCLAKDGHVCLSIAEKTIDDLLTEMGIVHEKEVPYPEGRYRCDFVSKDVFIEYFGFPDEYDYYCKIKTKQKICKRFGLRLVAIYPEDLLNATQLRNKLESIKALSKSDHGC